MFSRMIFGDPLPTWSLFAELIVAGSIVIFAGTRFAKQADAIAARYHLGSGLVGLILLATVTSLPELITSCTATHLANIDLALGGIFGSCCFNITIIFLINAMYGGGSVLRNVSPSHVLTSSFGLGLMGVALLGMVLMEKFVDRPVVARWVEISWAALVAVIYLGSMRLVYRFEKALPSPDASAADDDKTGNLLAVALMALIIMAASWWLAKLGDILSTHEIELIGRPLGATFVGAGFLALATSLPEIATSVAAVRLGNLNLALGNIFGSNMFNVFVIPAMKIVSLAGGNPIMLTEAGSHGNPNMIAGLLAILLTAIAVAGLAYQSNRKMLRRFGFDSILILLTYGGGMYLLLMGTE